jgi:hypothetical protein
MVTCKQVNKAIKALGGEEELVRGDGYMYFVGGDTENWEQSSVYVPRVGDLTVERWIEEYKSLKSNTIR